MWQRPAALTQVHHPCHLTNSTNWVHLMANNSSSASASDGKIKTALLDFGNGKGCVYFALWGCVYFASRGCFASWGKIKYMVLCGWIRLNRTDDFQKFCWSGLVRIQLLRIRVGLGLKNFTVRSSLLCGLWILKVNTQQWEKGVIFPMESFTRSLILKIFSIFVYPLVLGDFPRLRFLVLVSNHFPGAGPKVGTVNVNYSLQHSVWFVCVHTASGITVAGWCIHN